MLDQFTGELRRPSVAVVVETAAIFNHCAKSFRRGRVWEPEAWMEGALALEARYRQLDLVESFDEYASDNAVKIADGLAADVPG